MTTPKHLRTPKQILAMRRALGVPDSAAWDDTAQAAYRKRMEAISGHIYQADGRVASLPFDGRTVRDCACAVTATHNLLHEMNVPMPFETVYAWHCAHADPRFPGTIGWRARRFFRANTPQLRVYPAFTAKTLSKRLAKTGFALLCFAYGLRGAHYVAARQTPSGVRILDYLPRQDGSYAETEHTYPSVAAFLHSQKRLWLLWAYCLQKK